jgi:secreted PhoX family phosphatase
MTEDNGDPGDGFYRYLPHHKGKLHRGGKLQMLAIHGKPGFSTLQESKHGKKWECRWVDIHEPDPNGADDYAQAVYEQGRHKGATKFMGLEGGTFAKGSCYFTASDGGPAGQGQVWRYTPDNKNFKRGTLQLLYTSPRNQVLNGPDAIAVSPRGGIVLCEDGDGEDFDGADNWIRGVTPDGKLFNFAKITEPLPLHGHFAADLFPYNPRRWDRRPGRGVPVGASEASGVGFSPDGKWMFVHLQYPGETFAITGPWEKGWF